MLPDSLLIVYSSYKLSPVCICYLCYKWAYKSLMYFYFNCVRVDIMLDNLYWIVVWIWTRVSPVILFIPALKKLTKVSMIRCTGQNNNYNPYFKPDHTHIVLRPRSTERLSNSHAFPGTRLKSVYIDSLHVRPPARAGAPGKWCKGKAR